MKEYLINGIVYHLNTFEKIENANQAYFIGYLAGDGAYSKGTHKRLPRMSVSSINRNIIESIQATFCPDNAISSKWPVNKTRNIKAKSMIYNLALSSKFYTCFNKFGVLSTKDQRVLVNISKAYMRDYILGLYDADGHISFGYRKDRNRFWSSFVITHQSFDILSKVQKFLLEELSICSCITPRKDENCMDLKFSRITDVAKIMSWLYTNNQSMYSKVKYNRYSEFLSSYNE